MTPHDLFPGIYDWKRINCPDTEAEKRKEFAKFRAKIEAGQAARERGEIPEPGADGIEHLPQWLQDRIKADEAMKNGGAGTPWPQS